MWAAEQVVLLVAFEHVNSWLPATANRQVSCTSTAVRTGW